MNTKNTAAENVDSNTIDGNVTEVKKPDNSLVVMDPAKYATELFAPFLLQLAVAKRRASREKYDIKTKEGMATAKELRDTFVKIRTTADKSKTDAKRPIDQAGKLILTEFQTLVTAVKVEEDKHGAVIDAEVKRIAEEKERKLAEERARVEVIENRVAFIRNIPNQLAQAGSETINEKIEELSSKRLEPALYDEYLESAVTAINTAIDTMRILHATALEREAEARRVAAERAELARMKAEADARAKQDLQEKAQRAADERARADAAAAETARQAKEIADLKAKLAAAQKAAEPAPATESEAEVEQSMARAKQAMEGQPYGVHHPLTDAQDGGAEVQASIDTSHDSDDGVVTRNGKPVDPVPPAMAAAWRPTDEAILYGLARSFGIQPSMALKWLEDMDLPALRAAMVE